MEPKSIATMKIYGTSLGIVLNPGESLLATQVESVLVRFPFSKDRDMQFSIPPSNLMKEDLLGLKFFRVLCELRGTQLEHLPQRTCWWSLRTTPDVWGALRASFQIICLAQSRLRPEYLRRKYPVRCRWHGEILPGILFFPREASVPVVFQRSERDPFDLRINLEHFRWIRLLREIFVIQPPDLILGSKTKNQKHKTDKAE